MSQHQLQPQTECPKCEDGLLVDVTPVGTPADVDNGCMCGNEMCDFQSTQPQGELISDLIDVSGIDKIDSDYISTENDGFDPDASPSPTHTVSNQDGTEEFRLLLSEQEKPATGQKPKYTPFARQYPA
jgi:hypothetical protein